MNEVPPIVTGVQIVRRTFTVAMITIFAAVFSLVIWWWLTPPQIVVEADAGFKKAKQTIDSEQLRAWALKLIREWPETNGPQRIPESEIPPYIQNLYSYPPEDVSVLDNKVVIFLGGGFFHWVIEIGSTNFFKPFKNNYSEYQYNFEWTRGIYYTREASWKLQ